MNGRTPHLPSDMAQVSAHRTGPSKGLQQGGRNGTLGSESQQSLALSYVPPGHLMGTVTLPQSLLVYNLGKARQGHYKVVSAQGQGNWVQSIAFSLPGSR